MDENNSFNQPSNRTVRKSQLLTRKDIRDYYPSTELLQYFNFNWKGSSHQQSYQPQTRNEYPQRNEYNQMSSSMFHSQSGSSSIQHHEFSQNLQCQTYGNNSGTQRLGNNFGTQIHGNNFGTQIHGNNFGTQIHGNDSGTRRLNEARETFFSGNTFQPGNACDLQRSARYAKETQSNLSIDDSTHSRARGLNINETRDNNRNKIHLERVEITTDDLHPLSTNEDRHGNEYYANIEDAHKIENCVTVNANLYNTTTFPQLGSRDDIDDRDLSWSSNLIEPKQIIQKITGVDSFKLSAIKLNLKPVEAKFSITSKNDKFLKRQYRKPIGKNCSRYDESSCAHKAPKKVQEKSLGSNLETQSSKAIPQIQIKKVKYSLFSDFINFDKDESSTPSDSAVEDMSANCESITKLNEVSPSLTSDESLYHNPVNSKDANKTDLKEQLVEMSMRMDSEIDNENVQTNSLDQRANGKIVQTDVSTYDINESGKDVHPKLAIDRNGIDSGIVNNVPSHGQMETETLPAEMICLEKTKHEHETRVESKNVPRGVLFNIQDFQKKSKMSTARTKKSDKGGASTRKGALTKKGASHSKMSAPKNKGATDKKVNSNEVKKGACTRKKMSAKATKANLNKVPDSKPRILKHKIVFKQTQDTALENMMESAAEVIEEDGATEVDVAKDGMFGKDEKRPSYLITVSKDRTAQRIKDKLKRFSKVFGAESPLSKATNGIDNSKSATKMIVTHNDVISEHLGSFPEDKESTTTDDHNEVWNSVNNEPLIKKIKLDELDVREHKVLRFEYEDEILFVETQTQETQGLPSSSQNNSTKKIRVQFSNAKNKVGTKSSTIDHSLCERKHVKKSGGKSKTKFVPPIRKELLDKMKSGPLNSQVLDSQNVNSHYLEIQMDSQNLEPLVENLGTCERETFEALGSDFQSFTPCESKNTRFADLKFEGFEKRACVLDENNNSSSEQNLKCLNIEEDMVCDFMMDEKLLEESSKNSTSTLNHKELIKDLIFEDDDDFEGTDNFVENASASQPNIFIESDHQNDLETIIPTSFDVEKNPQSSGPSLSSHLVKLDVPSTSESAKFTSKTDKSTSNRDKSKSKERKSKRKAQHDTNLITSYFPAKQKPEKSLNSSSSSGQSCKASQMEESKFHLIELSNENIAEHTERLKNSPGFYHICLTIEYRENFCSMNCPEISPHQNVRYSPRNVFVRTFVHNNGQEAEEIFYLLPVISNYWAPVHKPMVTEFIDSLLAGGHRVVCYEAQSLIMLLNDLFMFNRAHVCTRWKLADPLIGYWLLNPDETQLHYKDICGKVQSDSHRQMVQICVNDSSRLVVLKSLQSLTGVMEWLDEQLIRNRLDKVFYEMEMAILPTISLMELQSIQVDRDQCRRISGALNNTLVNLEYHAHKEAGKIINLNSPQQLAQVLYNDLKLDVKYNLQVKRTCQKFAKSTSEVMLKRLEPYHPLPKIILEYRRLQKLKSTYVDGILQCVQDKENTLSTCWEVTSAATGRLTSSSPNLQSIPRGEVTFTDGSLSTQMAITPRSVFLARPGYVLLAADFQHMELRIFAHFTRDPILLHAFNSGQEDVFCILAKKWLNIQGEVTSEEREKTKRVVYSIMYGVGIDKLAEYLDIENRQAYEIINKFTAIFPGIKKFTQKVIQCCQESGYLSSLSGRRRYFKNIHSGDFGLRGYAQRQAVNFMIQGSAADICKAAMLSTQRALYVEYQCQEADIHLLLQIHDELVWQVRESLVHRIIPIVKHCMENITETWHSELSLCLPLPVKLTSGPNWGDMRPVE